MTEPQLYTAKPVPVPEDMQPFEDWTDTGSYFLKSGFIKKDGYVTGQLIYDNVGRPIICDSFEMDENGFYSDGSYVVIDPKTLKKVEK